MMMMRQVKVTISYTQERKKNVFHSLTRLIQLSFAVLRATQRMLTSLHFAWRKSIIFFGGCKWMFNFSCDL